MQSRRVIPSEFHLFSLELLDQYQKTLGVTLKPCILKCLFREDLSLGGDGEIEDAEESLSYYQKLHRFLSEKLEKLSIAINPEMFDVLVNQGATGDQMEVDEQPKLERLFFGEKLENLQALKIDLYTPDYWVESDDDSRNFGLEDVQSLEKLTPNLRELTIRHSLILNSFISALLDSPLLAQIQDLDFDYSVIQSRFCLGELLASPQLSNLKRLGLPFLDQEVHPELEEILEKFKGNKSLGSLETLVITDQELPMQTVVQLLIAIGGNSSLVNFKSIEGLEIIGSKLLPKKILETFRELKLLHLKNFEFECVEHLFEG